MLRFNGIGQNVAWGMYNNDNSTEAQKQRLYEIYWRPGRFRAKNGGPAGHRSRPARHPCPVAA